jgi:hypothetical protein
VNYGRDSDSIATMAGAITGALGGAGAIPNEWVEQVAEASRLDFATTATRLVEVARQIWRRDAERLAARDSVRRRYGDLP